MMIELSSFHSFYCFTCLVSLALLCMYVFYLYFVLCCQLAKYSWYNLLRKSAIHSRATLNVKCSTVDQTCWTRRSDESVDLIFNEQSDDIPSSYFAAAARIQWHETAVQQQQSQNSNCTFVRRIYFRYTSLAYCVELEIRRHTYGTVCQRKSDNTSHIIKYEANK